MVAHQGARMVEPIELALDDGEFFLITHVTGDGFQLAQMG